MQLRTLLSWKHRRAEERGERKEVKKKKKEIQMTEFGKAVLSGPCRLSPGTAKDSSTVDRQNRRIHRHGIISILLRSILWYRCEVENKNKNSKATHWTLIRHDRQSVVPWSGPTNNTVLSLFIILSVYSQHVASSLWYSFQPSRSTLLSQSDYTLHETDSRLPELHIMYYHRLNSSPKDWVTPGFIVSWVGSLVTQSLFLFSHDHTRWWYYHY